MSEPFLIQPDALYWVQIDDRRIKVRALRSVPEAAGWWLCRSVRSGTEFAVPEVAFCAEIED